MATLMDIAKLANVNKSTVSKVINNSSEISAETKKKIWAIIDKLGYTPNETAQILAGKKSRTIGLVINEIDANYYNDVVGVIERKLSERDYSLLVAITGFNIDSQINYIKLFLQKRVDGLIIKPSFNDEFVSKLKKIKKALNIPVVLLSKPIPDIDLNVIEYDNHKAMELSVEHLTGLGHKNIYFICDEISQIRKQFFIKILREKNLPINENHYYEGSERFQNGGYLRMKELIAEHNKNFAVIAHYDSMANGAMKAIYESNLKVPDDISIVGFDNISESAYYQVPLTTIEFANSDIGKEVSDMLFAEIESEEIKSKRHIMLKPTLVIRESTGPAKV